MQIFKTRLFERWAKAEPISDQALVKATAELNEGLVDAALGGNVYKKRVAKSGQGKSGGYRTILAFKIKDKAFFMYGFAAVLSISARLLAVLSLAVKTRSSSTAKARRQRLTQEPTRQHFCQRAGSTETIGI